MPGSEPDWSFPYEEPIHDDVPRAPRRAEGVAQPDRLAAGARPQDPRAHPHGVHRDRPQTCRHRAPRPLARRWAPPGTTCSGSIMLTVPGFGVRRGGRGHPARPSRLRRCADPEDDDEEGLSERTTRAVPDSPAITDRNEPFWTGGADGELRFQRCQECGYWIHPPTPVCPMCLSKDLAYEAVSGRATCTPSRSTTSRGCPVPSCRTSWRSWSSPSRTDCASRR